VFHFLWRQLGSETSEGERGKLLLASAEKASSVEVLKLIMRTGLKADWSPSGRLEDTALIAAAQNANEAAITLLLDENASTQAVETPNLWTALHHCSYGGLTDSVNELLNYGANASAIGLFKLPPR